MPKSLTKNLEIPVSKLDDHSFPGFDMPLMELSDSESGEDIGDISASPGAVFVRLKDENGKTQAFEVALKDIAQAILSHHDIQR